jgi:3',5'-cyclic AMP phosphodiesterase CpdA
MTRIRIILALAALAVSAGAEQPQFSFGVIADVQYADKDTAGVREYRRSSGKLEQCAALLRKERPAFTIQLGDLVDGGLPNLDRILQVYRRMPAPRYHVLGNHDFCADRPTLLKHLDMPAAYYDFAVHGWRFVVLDSMQQSVAGSWPEDDPHAVAGRQLLEKLRASRAVNAQTWDGALGPEQREWLRGVLRKAGRQHERAIVFAHAPVLPESCRPAHLLWDYREVLEILKAEPAVAAYVNGHDHLGGYAQQDGIHFVTLPAVVEHEVSQSCQVMDVFPDRLVLRQAGTAAGRALQLR